MTALDKQVAGDHYKKLKIQPIEYIHANNIPFAEGCAIKYLTRWRDKGGGHLFKWMPPLKGKEEWRRIGVESGWGVQVCNDIRDAGRLPVDFDYYVREVEKLVLGMS